MVEPIVEPNDKLSIDDIRALPPYERSKFIESSVLALINANGTRGLTTSEIERATHYPKNTLLKSIELLFCKRKVHRITRGKFGIYYPNGDSSPETNFRDIMYGRNNVHRYGVRVINNIDGKYVHIQEREMDENGFLEDIGGVLIPVEKITELINMLLLITKQSQVMVKENRSK
ncbi:MAG: hypothetical protein HY223_06375 [Thaumarchaeota archaeon]|nr:hypothetical protein [Nitrososphaerota archaeon]